MKFLLKVRTTVDVDYLKKTFNHNDIFNDTTTLDDGYIKI